MANKSGEAPSWFNNEIINGIQKLAALSLNGTPPSETIALTAIAWVETLWSANIAWTQELDTQRIEHAFKKLSREAERWPSPKQFLDLLPNRPEPKKLPSPTVDKDQAKANINRIKQTLKQAFKTV